MTREPTVYVDCREPMVLSRIDEWTNGLRRLYKRTNGFEPNGQGNQRLMSIVQENQWFWAEWTREPTIYVDCTREPMVLSRMDKGTNGLCRLYKKTKGIVLLILKEK